MEPKARKLMFVGYSNEHKAYRLLDTGSGRITISRDVKFLEDWRMYSENGADRKLEVTESTVELEPLPVPEITREVAPVSESEEEPEVEEDFDGYESAEDLPEKKLQ
ncbi:uncharacterized protein LOC135714874 [Ochlerotatus camptorhynchus]|uniref:uncharacterized protein LOC135714874 n=1 Tax=Ochlerotatus camptorhynchus TaxID=644619 RepID=UPI0031CEFA2E